MFSKSKDKKEGGHALESLLEKRVKIITNDGRVFIGKHISTLIKNSIDSFIKIGYLRGLDQMLNVVLSDCEERIFSVADPVQTVKIGLYLIRGENIMIIGN